MRSFMINCKESAIRSSELRDRGVTGIRTLELWYHLVICQFCRIYHKQIRKLSKVSRLLGAASAGGIEEVPGESLSAEAKVRIKNSLLPH